MKEDRVILLAKFAWHLHLDAAYLRGCLSFGLKKMSAVFATPLDDKRNNSFIKAHQKFDQSFLSFDFLNPARWAMVELGNKKVSNHDPDIQDVLDLYEEWLWQLTHFYVYKKHLPKGRIYAELHKAFSWQTCCKSSHEHSRIHLYDFDRLMREGRKLPPDDLYTRVIVSRLPAVYEDHPSYPKQLLGTMNDKLVARNFQNTLKSIKKDNRRKK